jgi:hypothetical protein
MPIQELLQGYKSLKDSDIEILLFQKSLIAHYNVSVACVGR